MMGGMLDARLRPLVRPLLDGVAHRLAGWGIWPLAVTAVSFAAGVGAAVSAALAAWTTALVLWVVSWVLDGVDGPLAHATGGTSELGGFLDIVSDFAVYGGFVVGVAIAVPEARLACAALLLAYYVSGTAFLALSSLLERRGSPEQAERSLRFVGGVAEGTETFIAYVAFCLLPAQAVWIAWVFAAAVGVTALQRTWVAVRLLREAPA